MVDETTTERPRFAPAPPPPPPPPRHSGVLLFLAMFSAVVVAGGLVVLGMFAGGIIGVAAGVAGSALMPTVYQKGEGSQKIAVIPVEGVIDGSTVAFVHQAVEALLQDHDVKAVILRVESPGGGATASDEILREVQRVKRERDLPLIASYGDYAASGGYYVSCQADVIIAQPTCITGSIGVIAPYFSIERLLSEKLGVTPEVVTSTAAVDKDTASMFRAWTDKDRTTVRRLLDGVQEQFVSVVAEGRKGKLTADEVKQIATGAAMLAGDALKAKLVDRIGYFDDAIAEARERGGIKAAKPPVIIYNRAAGLLAELGASSSQGAASAGALPVTLDVAMLRKWAAELAVPRRMMIVRP